jgi:DNA-binding transcriptional regulator/RsmH inhibitor MraZ
MAQQRKYPKDIDNQRFIAWHRARAQANFRKEGWTITEEQWFEIWTPKKWQLRGRASSDLCLIRKDIDKPWSVNNIEMVTRKQQLAKQQRGSPWWQRQYQKYCGEYTNE